MSVDFSTFLSETAKAEEMLARAKYRCIEWGKISPLFSVGLLVSDSERALNQIIRRAVVQASTTSDYDASEAIEALIAFETGIQGINVAAYTNLMLRDEWDRGAENIIVERIEDRTITDVTDVPVLENNRCQYKTTMNRIIPGSVSWDQIGEEVRRLPDLNRSFRKHLVQGWYVKDSVGIAVKTHTREDKELVLDIIDWHENTQRKDVPRKFDAVEFLPLQLTTSISGRTDPCNICYCDCDCWVSEEVTCGWYRTCGGLTSCCGCRMCPNPPPACGCNTCAGDCTRYTCQYYNEHPSWNEWYCKEE